MIKDIKSIFVKKVWERDHTFLVLLRFALGISNDLPESISDDTWKAVYAMAERQAMLGLIYDGVQRMPSHLQPKGDFLINWFMQARKIQIANKQMTKEAQRWTDFFAANGLKSCILKGLGNGLMYPNPSMRTPGDIDIYVEGGEETIMPVLDANGITGEVCEHHIHLEHEEGQIETEIHFLATQGSRDEKKNAMMQEWFIEELKTTREADGYYVPTPRFNRIMQLAHMQHHFTVDGMSLRQLTDYYHVLRQESNVDMKKELKRFGLLEFAEGVMYIMKTFFLLDDQYLIARPHKRRGEAIFSAVIDSGSFGLYGKDTISSKGFFSRNIYHTIDLLNNISLFPTEYSIVFKGYLAGFFDGKKTKNKFS